MKGMPSCTQSASRGMLNAVKDLKIFRYAQYDRALHILSSCHPVILSSCHPVILSSCHPVIPAELSFSVTRSYQPIPVIPAKERHPSTVTSPSEGTSPQRRNVTPAKERHPSEGWGWYPEQLDSRLRENDENSAHPRHTSPSPSYQRRNVTPAKAGAGIQNN